MERSLLGVLGFVTVARNVTGTTHKNGVQQVWAHELLVTQEQKARGAQNRSEEILPLVQGAYDSQRDKKVRYTALLGPIVQW